MADVITMPRLSDTMEEGTIVEWFKSVGDQVSQGDILAEVETDKANMELESFYEGKLLYVGINQGDVIPVDQIIAVVGEEGEDYQKALDEARQKSGAEPEQEAGQADKPEKTQEPEKASEAETKESNPTQAASVVQQENGGQNSDERIKASPLAKKLAQEKGIDIKQIDGSGDNGRIIKRDIERAEEEGVSKPASSSKPKTPNEAEDTYEDVPLSQMRKTIAKRLVESKFSAPHFYLTMEINMDRAIEARKRINEVAEVKTSFNDLIVKAASVALRRNPRANASWLGDKIRYYHNIHTGVAVAVEEGLVVPVIRHADQKGVAEIATESQVFAEKAHNKQLQPEDFEGNTFTVSNLGMFGIDQFTAIINPPDSCILAIGKIKQQPTIQDEQLHENNVMTVTLSCDHRVVDGAIGSNFLKTFKEIMEDPLRLVI